MFSAFTLPALVVAVLAFGFGVVIGSFLNVVIYRLHTGRSLQGRSHCLSCGVTLEWYDLLPLVSYVVLRRRCRACESIISGRYFWVELLTGLLFVGTIWVASSWFALLLFWLVSAVLVVVVVYDYYHLIIPDRLVLWLLGLAVVWLAYQWWLEVAWLHLGYDVLAALGGAGVYAMLWLISKGQWLGLGDAKLALPLGLLLGYEHIFSLLVYSFWIGAAISVLLIGYQKIRRRGQPHLRFLQQPLTIKSEVPFAPFLVLSFLVIYFFGIDALELTELLLHSTL